MIYTFRKDALFSPYHNQSHYREVPWWEIFMEQELRFGLDLDQLALLKKKTFGLIMSNFWGRFFQVFLGKKNKLKTLYRPH